MLKPLNLKKDTKFGIQGTDLSSIEKLSKNDSDKTIFVKSWVNMLFDLLKSEPITEEKESLLGDLIQVFKREDRTSDLKIEYLYFWLNEIGTMEITLNEKRKFVTNWKKKRDTKAEMDAPLFMLARIVEGLYTEKFIAPLKQINICHNIKCNALLLDSRRKFCDINCNNAFKIQTGKSAQASKAYRNKPNPPSK